MRWACRNRGCYIRERPQSLTRGPKEPFRWLRCEEGKNDVVIVIVLEEFQESTDVRMSIDHSAFNPRQFRRGPRDRRRAGLCRSCFAIVTEGRRGYCRSVIALVDCISQWIPRSLCRKNVARMRDRGHDIYLYWNGAVLRMLFPTVGENTRLDDLFYDDGGPKTAIRHLWPSAFDEAICATANLGLDDKVGNAAVAQGIANDRRGRARTCSLTEQTARTAGPKKIVG
ncbi:unnamed protein product [Mycena citricolor]|uniref:Uncharacterized protein n=1 Tax=Mycena citricolor TaxID=2018698 RepID=A0AAD2HSK5_9AGAR|nr:unnamed protein product [Mycena citricolor]